MTLASTAKAATDVAHRASGPAILRYRLAPVATDRQLTQFIEVPWTVFRGDPTWSPPLKFERRQLLSAKTNPYFGHAEARYFLATKDGEPVGRISAQVCRLVQARMGQGTGQFGFFDAIEDAALATALFDAAEEWLVAKGMSRAIGPFNLSINEEVGMLIDGFDMPPFMLMGHAKPYYRDFVDGAGYGKLIDMFAYLLGILDDFPPSIIRMVEWGDSRHNIHMRNIDMKQFEQEIRTVLDIFNDAWQDNWGFIPMTEAEIAKAAKDLRPLIRPHNTRIVEFEGEPAAFMTSLPDLNRITADLNGNLLPFGWAKLAYRLWRDRFEAYRVPLMGVRKSVQRTRAGGVMALMLIKSLRDEAVKRGGRYGELSWILENNMPMRRMLESIGSRIYKTYRVYEKALR